VLHGDTRARENIVWQVAAPLKHVNPFAHGFCEDDCVSSSSQMQAAPESMRATQVVVVLEQYNPKLHCWVLEQDAPAA